MITKFAPTCRSSGPDLAVNWVAYSGLLAGADHGELARTARANRTQEIDGIELESGDLLVSMSGKPGFAVAEEAGYAVAVTTKVTPELAEEGLARELVRRIQEMRKTAGFEIADPHPSLHLKAILAG